MAWIEHDYADGDALTDAVAAQLHDRCAAGLKQHGRALLSLAGKSASPPWSNCSVSDWITLKACRNCKQNEQQNH